MDCCVDFDSKISLNVAVVGSWRHEPGPFSVDNVMTLDTIERMIAIELQNDADELYVNSILIDGSIPTRQFC